jgi:hypothetical protein
MKTAERRARLIEWLEILHANVQQLLLDDHLFWEFQKIVEGNGQFQNASGLFLQFVAGGYIRSAAIGIRRQAKSDRNSVSVLRFLDEVRDYPHLVSRERCQAPASSICPSQLSSESQSNRSFGVLLLGIIDSQRHVDITSNLANDSSRISTL